jgi:uncharacterized SAM-binding protein YcdF (DUF218 family)
VTLVAALIVWAALAREFAPLSNTNQVRFDAIIVLGSPVDSDGNPTPQQLAHVVEGVREYMRGVAPRIIVTGGPTRHGFVEADVMARVAESQGIPESAVFVEPRAMDTIENACYSDRIMKAHGWRSAEVVSSAYHLPRAAMIFGRRPMQWRMRAAPPVAPESEIKAAASSALETLKTVRYLIYADWAEGCTP